MGEEKMTKEGEMEGKIHRYNNRVMQNSKNGMGYALWYIAK